MDEEQYNKMRMFRKIIIITVIVLLILWLIFFMRLSVRVKDDIIDENYNKNVDLMEKAASEYFTKDVLEEDSVISLKKMYELDLIDTLKTSEGDKCIDFASYAKVIELEDKYRLDVILVCGDNEKVKTTYYDLSCGLSCKK